MPNTMLCRPCSGAPRVQYSCVLVTSTGPRIERWPGRNGSTAPWATRQGHPAAPRRRAVSPRSCWPVPSHTPASTCPVRAASGKHKACDCCQAPGIHLFPGEPMQQCQGPTGRAAHIAGRAVHALGKCSFSPCRNQASRHNQRAGTAGTCGYCSIEVLLFVSTLFHVPREKYPQVHAVPALDDIRNAPARDLGVRIRGLTLQPFPIDYAPAMLSKPIAQAMSSRLFAGYRLQRGPQF